MSVAPALVGTLGDGQEMAKPVLVLALLAFFLGTSVLIATVLGVITRAARPEERIRRRLSFYTLSGRQARLEQQVEQHRMLGNSLLARSAMDLAEKVSDRQGFGEVIDGRLEAAALPIRTPEWLLVHLGCAVGLGLLFLGVSGGSLLGAVCGLVLGLVGPWVFLRVREGRRETAFLAQLPDTLQMLAGSLQAGYSLPQALDTVVREGQPPMSVEFNRALVESRLGMPVEDALEGIGRRLSSQDFSWVVMAVRIQRDVGGNLAELLTTVADTLRARAAPPAGQGALRGGAALRLDPRRPTDRVLRLPHPHQPHVCASPVEQRARRCHARHGRGAARRRCVLADPGHQGRGVR